MITNNASRTWLALFLLLSPFLAGCMSSRGYQQALDDRDAEIRRLREERASLKAQNQSLKSSLDNANGELADVVAQPAGAPTEKFPELDNLGISYGMRDGNMVISIPSSITFASGQSTLSKDGQKALREVASTLKKEYGEAEYSIEGHTDTDPIVKSKFSSNRELSVSRAMAVLTFLVAECGIPDSRCIVAGHGEYEPVAANDSKPDKAKNRRVEIVVYKTGA
ncbi:MAG: OmpA family protein [Planctomycetota bacterium]